jgi:hypothetical protein
MRFDIQNELSSEQAFTGAATVSTNSYQKQSAAQDISIGRRMALLVYFHAAGAGTTHTLEAVQADVTALTTNIEVLSTVSVTTSALPADKFVEIPIPQGVMDRLHLGFRHTATGGTTTATISCWLVPQDEIASYKSFPKVVDAEIA